MLDPMPTPPRLAASRHHGETLAAAYDTRRNNFDFIRFALATTVIWSHSFPLLGRPADPVYVTSGQVNGGTLAVDAFFIVSGFLVTQSWLSCPQVTIFAAKRFLRIVPALVAALMFGALLIAPVASTVSPDAYLFSSEPWRHFLGIALHRYLYLPTVFSTNPIPHLLNSPLWSLRYEIICYAGVALLGSVQPRRWPALVATTFALTWLCFSSCASIAADSSLAHIVQSSARLLTCFSAGMFFYVFRARVPYHVGFAGAAALVLFVAFFTGGFRIAFPLLGGYLLLYLACSPLLPLSGFARHGDFSYGLYVFAFPIQQLMIHLLGVDIPLTGFFLTSVLAALTLAYASWHLLEAPALSLKPGRRVYAAGARPAASAARLDDVSAPPSLPSRDSAWDSRPGLAVGAPEK